MNIVGSRRFSMALVISLLTLLAVNGWLFFHLKQSSVCENDLKSGKRTGFSAGKPETAISYLELLNVNVCVVILQESSDRLFPDTSARLKIGFYDRFGILHIYPARLGGVDDTGRELKVGLCQSGKCQTVDPQEAVSGLRIGQIINAEIVYRDQAPWPGAKQHQTHQPLFDKLRKALYSGHSFPGASPKNDFMIQIWQIRI